MKKLMKFLIILILSLLLTSCAFFSDPNFRVKVLENSGESWDNLAFFVYVGNIYGYDRDTMELKVYLEINHFVSEPLIVNNMMFLGDQGAGSTWGGHVFVIDKDYRLKKSIECLDLIDDFHLYKNTLVADSSRFYGGGCGISFIDIDSLTLRKDYIKLSGMPFNVSTNCGYDNKIYIASAYDPYSKPVNITIFDEDTLDVIETTDRYQKDYIPPEMSEILIYENQLWVFSIKENKINVFNLDNDEQLALIDVHSSMNLDDENEYRFVRPFVKDGKVYSSILRMWSADIYSYMLCFNADSFELENIMELPVNGNTIEGEFLTFDSHPDYIFFNDGLDIYKYNVTTGQVEVKVKAPSTTVF